MKSPKTVVQDWVAAYNARDPQALIELYHDDAENHQVAFGAPLHGREALHTNRSNYPEQYNSMDLIFYPCYIKQ